ncbi:MAG TPA: DUF2062 domain-containing protein [Gammaproteobacteria bacterium]|nr:DUF2062 domain-containing protein [Gammaproteobacteria bacterium]
MKNTVKKWLPTEHRMRAWLGAGRMGRWLTARKGLWSLHRRALAGGIAVGLFIGLTPTVGFQTPLILAGALILRVNFPMAFLALWVSNPLTTPVLYWAFNRLGAWVFGDHLTFGALANLNSYLQVFLEQSAFMWLGSLLLAVPAAVLGYSGFIWLWRYGTVRRWRRRAESRAATPADPA